MKRNAVSPVAAVLLLLALPGCSSRERPEQGDAAGQAGSPQSDRAGRTPETPPVSADLPQADPPADEPVPTVTRQEAWDILRRIGFPVPGDAADPAGLKLEALDLSPYRYQGGDLVVVTAFEELKKVDLHNGTFDDQALRYLTVLPQLKVLDLNTSQVGDDGLRYVARIKSLEVLRIAATRVTGAGLMHLGGLPKLRELQLNGNQKIDDDGMASLASVTTLEWVHLYETAVSDAGVVPFLQDKRLVFLRLGRTRVGDATLAALADQTDLEQLDVYKCPAVTDEGIRHLAGLKKLKSLNVQETQVTASGAAALGQALPECSILH